MLRSKIVDTVYDKGQTALLRAARDNKLSIVKSLLSAGADINKATPNGATPLYIASQKGYTEIVKLLVSDSRTDINKATQDGATPLNIASYKGYTEIVKLLVSDSRTDINKATYYGATPLHIASYKGHIEIVKLLVSDSRTDINKAKQNGATPLYVASEEGHTEIVKLFISDSRTVVNTPFQITGTTPLFVASQKGYTEIVKLLVSDSRTDINKATHYGATPLYIASEEGHTEIVKVLVSDSRTDINKAKQDGYTPLLIACYSGYLEVVKLLLTRPDIDKANAIEAARQKRFSDEINDLLLGQPKKRELWKGWTRSDVDRLNEIFDKTTAPNISLCPICLKTVTRDQGCMHMKHDCKALSGFYHKRLYDLYKTAGKIHWCTICGRIGYSQYGGDFYHYKLGQAKDGKPETHGPTQVYDESCATRSGGGGIEEKIKRFYSIREMALSLNTPEYINILTDIEAKEKLVEAMWDAPLHIKNPRFFGLIGEKSKIAKNVKAQSWITIPNTAFATTYETATTTTNSQEALQAPNAPIPPTHLDPIVHPEETEEFQNATILSDKDIIQFRHEGNMHDKEGQQISQESFFSMLQTNLINPTDEGYLKCWSYSQEGDNKCNVKLYPREVRIALGLAEAAEEGENADYRKLYELYRKKFNEAEAGLTGGARKHRTRRRSRK